MDLESITKLTAGTFELGFDLLRFANLTKLHLELPNDENVPGIETTLLCLPMQNIFPSVTEVTLGDEAYVNDEENLIQHQFGEPKLWPAVTKITVMNEWMVEPLLWDVAPLFPSVQSIVIKTVGPDPERELFHWLWGNWPRLEFLELGSEPGWEVNEFRENYDAEFCGIFPEEADLLRQMDEDYLKVVHIVPLFPAILHLEALRDVKIKLNTENMYSHFEDLYDDDDWPPGSRATFFLSKVTRFIGMRQSNHVKFQLTVADRRIADYLEYLKPWVELQVREDTELE